MDVPNHLNDPARRPPLPADEAAPSNSVPNVPSRSRSPLPPSLPGHSETPSPDVSLPVPPPPPPPPGAQKTTSQTPATPFEKKKFLRRIPKAARLLTGRLSREKKLPKRLAWASSLFFHLVLLAVLASLVISLQSPTPPAEFILTQNETKPVESLPTTANRSFELFQDDEVTRNDFSALKNNLSATAIVAGAARDFSSIPETSEITHFGIETAPRADLLNEINVSGGSGLAGRSQAMRKKLVEQTGGSPASERAVAAALNWLALHQMPDGGWNFNHTLAPSCHGQCRNPGQMVKARNAATGLALMAFLGAGHTHKEGKYKNVVRAGLEYLINHMKVSPNGGWLYEQDTGTMYSHGIASIALCEAYAMTQDKKLQAPAQAVVNFTCFAQDPVGGGWRYEPKQRGDTSVAGWQLMSLKSAQMANLKIAPTTFPKAIEFLNFVQDNGGATYGYTDAGEGKATTAIGLLCRMYLGWRHDNPSLKNGVLWLSEQGPSKENMYYNYYATQVMRHWQGKEWDHWNSILRDYLIDTQATKGHEEGSWFFPGEEDYGGMHGGRVYYTAVSAMILEVYYRHMPIYKGQSIEQAEQPKK